MKKTILHLRLTFYIELPLSYICIINTETSCILYMVLHFLGWLSLSLSLVIKGVTGDEARSPANV